MQVCDPLDVLRIVRYLTVVPARYQQASNC